MRSSHAKLKEAREEAGEAVDHAQRAAELTAKAAADEVREVTDGLKNRADSARDRVRAGTRETVTRAKDLYTTGDEKVRGLTNQCRKVAREQPGLALLAAALIGFAAGVLWRRQGAQRD